VGSVTFKGRLPTRMRAAVLSVVAALATVALTASAAAAAEQFGVSKWEAGTCVNVGCTDSGPIEYFYTQAAGHPNFGITDFRMNGVTQGVTGAVLPTGHVENVRVDLPEGLAVNPEAAPRCPKQEFEASKCEPDTQVGEDEATGTVKVSQVVAEKIEKSLPVGGLVGKLLSGSEVALTITEKFAVYNVERESGQVARFGILVKSATLELAGIEAHIYIDGGLSWHTEAPAPDGENSGVTSGDFHEFFRIPDIPEAPELVESKLIFWGDPHQYHAAAPEKSFITMPSNCNGPQTTILHVSSHEEPERYFAYSNQTPVGATGCGGLEFMPQIGQKPESVQSDAPDGTEVKMLVPQRTDEPVKPNTPDPREAKVILPEGMTLNPSAVNGLEACANSQFKMGTDEKIECPAKSTLGTVAINAPGIPNGSLVGNVYLGTPLSSEPASGLQYRVLIAAEAPEYDIGLRLEGHVSADPDTGRLVTTFTDLPPVPFEEFNLKFKAGPTAPLANPLSCGAVTTSASLLSYAGQTAAPSSPFAVIAPACPPGFAVLQSAKATSTKAASSTTFTLGLTRPEGQQYISSLSTALPEGMIGQIPAVPLCKQAQASADKCPAASQVGSASVTIGSGSSPLALPTGPVYLTGPYQGAPFGLEILTNASKVGPYDYGTISTRAKIDIDPFTARVNIAAAPPTIVGGVPIRLRSLSVTVDHPGFLLDPTNCGDLSTDTSLVSSFGATDAVSTPFKVTDCSALPFSPSFSASTSAKHTRRFGASLDVSVTEKPGQANIKSVDVMLPRRIVANLKTLNYACPEKTFATSPSSCPAQSKVGSAHVTTPTLPGTLTGSAYFVSRGGAGFPNLDLVLSGDGVTIILVGQTNISGDYTHSKFASLPDVPIHSFNLKLPTSSNSALSGNGSFCKGVLRMPTTIVAQNGKTVRQRTKLKVFGCKGRSAKNRKVKHGKRTRHS
jgi:hypothetical protein